MTNSKLSDKKCAPCEKGGSHLIEEEIDSFMNEISGDWCLAKCGKKISRDFKFKNFIQALEFVNRVGEIAESEGHHPDIVLKWGFVGIELWTHAVGGLTENDFILASKIDQLP